MLYQKVLILLFIIFSTLAFAQESKWNVCTVTINSDDEKKAFIDHLSKGKNKNKFQFTELTDFAKSGNKDDWFEKSCQSGIQCDVLLISGHFAGSFFGESDLSLNNNTLDKHSCNKSCSGILSNPTEVFLFGCNTLAGKEDDGRTYEEYIDALLSDGISRPQAEQIANARYSPIGNSFRDQNKRIFSNVPHIYGFDSKGPLGKNVRHLIDDYFERISDYSNHLAVENLKLSEAYNDFFLHGKTKKGKVQKIKNNKHIEEALKITHFAQVSQTPIRCGDNYVGGEDSIKDIICDLKDPKISQTEKLEIALNTLESPHVNGLIPNISSFIDSIETFSPQDINLLQKYSKKKKLKNDLFTLLTNLSKYSPRYAIELSNTLDKIELIKKDNQKQILKDSIKNIFKQDILYTDMNYLCSMKDEHKNYTASFLEYDKLNKSVLNSSSGLRTVLCLNPKDKKFDNIKKKLFTGDIKVYDLESYAQRLDLDSIAKNVGYSDILQALDSTDTKKQKAALTFFNYSNITNEKDADKLVSIAIKEQNTTSNRSLALRAIKSKLSNNAKKKVIDLITNDKDIMIRNRAVRLLQSESNIYNLTYEDLMVVAKSLKKTTGNLKKEPYKAVYINSAISLLNRFKPLPNDIIQELKKRKLKPGDSDEGFSYFFKNL